MSQDLGGSTGVESNTSAAIGSRESLDLPRRVPNEPGCVGRVCDHRIPQDEWHLRGAHYSIRRQYDVLLPRSARGRYLRAVRPVADLRRSIRRGLPVRISHGRRGAMSDLTALMLRGAARMHVRCRGTAMHPCHRARWHKWLRLVERAVLAGILASAVADAQSFCPSPGTRSGAVSRMRSISDTLWTSSRSGELVGQVHDLDGRPVEGVDAHLIGPLPASARLSQRRSDSVGLFVFTNIPPARYELFVRRVGYLYQRHEIAVIPAGKDSVCIALRAAEHFIKSGAASQQRSR